MPIKAPKKLIEVALPLDDINAAAAREKSIRHGHPSTLHLWWARRPLAAARAVLFAQLVNDPGGERGYFAGRTRAQADAERERLFQIIRDLVKWENTNNEEVLERARAEIRKSWRETCELNGSPTGGKPGFDPDQLPAFHDPFAGGGAIPLEAQRLGLESHASDLNPVAVLINKAMIEIPPKFAGRKPVGPMLPGDTQGKMHEDWSGARGLAEDVRRYGHWMREQAEQRIGHLYPKVQVTAEMAVDRPDLKPYVGESLTVIAWLWARTVKSPNPAFAHVDVPLISTYVLSSRAGREAWLEPETDGDSYQFKVRVGKPSSGLPPGTKAGSRGANFNCIVSGAPISADYIRSENMAVRAASKMIAIVVEGNRRRIYLEADNDQEEIARNAVAEWKPDEIFFPQALGFRVGNYGMSKWSDLFTNRQLTVLSTLTQLVAEARETVEKACGNHEDSKVRELAKDYADAVAVYLAFAVSKCTDYSCALCDWHSSGEKIGHLFSRQAIPMKWDFCEANLMSDSSGNFRGMVEWVAKVLDGIRGQSCGFVHQANAQTQEISDSKVVSTDPPYYDNVGYADLSDFFYVWLRKSLRGVVPNIFGTMSTPKNEELVATPARHGGRAGAEDFFMTGMSQAMAQVSQKSHSAFPVTIYYAFKQADMNSEGSVGSTGWETFLDSVIKSGFSIVGTWPMRTELSNRMRGIGSNALASSIVIVASKREATADTISRRDFQRQLRAQMPEALETMIGGTTGQSPIAPVDLAQAAIGPGMAIYSKYAGVLNQDGTPMSVHDALILINREITEFLTPDAGSFEADTLFCNSWFEQYGWGQGAFGEADVLARGKGTSVGGVQDAGVVEAGAGKVRLLRWKEYPAGWDPRTDERTPVWEALHQLLRALNQQGESAAGALLARMPEKGEAMRQLAYHLYTLCERKKWAEDARAYNELITAWPAIVAAAHEAGHRHDQTDLDF